MIDSNLAQYRIESELGRGGMGVVYKAHDTRLDRMVAIKVLPTHLSQDENAQLRFEQEAKAASRLHHPNICSVYELGTTEQGDTFMVMPLYHGGTLEDRIAEGNLPHDEAVAYAKQIASALAKAHVAGIIHRDVKPANIMLEEDRAVLMDFGVAKLGESGLTQTGSTIGTMAYMSPEQARGEDLDARSDLWSMGVILYEMISGRRPFAAPYREAQLFVLLNEDPDALNGGDPELDAVVERLLKKDRNERFGSADELLKAFSSAGAPDGSQATMATLATSPTAAIRTRRFGLAALVTCLALLIVFFWPDGAEGEESVYRTLAVFPFRAGPGSDTSLVRFADAKIGELLGHVSEISVAPIRLSRAQMTNSGSVEGAADKLAVDAYLTGELTSGDGRVTVEVFLHDSRTHSLLWTETLSGAESDLAIFSSLSRGAANATKLSVSDAELARMSLDRQVNPDALALYVRGRALNERQDLGTAQQLLTEAVGLDPNFAEAHAELANTYGTLALNVDPETFWPLTREAAENAIHLDSTSAAAWSNLGAYFQFHRWDWQAAEAAYRDAVALAPNDPTVRLRLAQFYVAMGRSDEARSELSRARSTPWGLVALDRMMMGFQYMLLEDYERSIRLLDESLSLYPSFQPLSITRATSLALIGDSAAAVEELDAVMPRPGTVATSPLGPWVVSWGVLAYAVAGNDDKARPFLNELTAMTEERYMCTFEIALTYAHLGDMGEAFQWFDEAERVRSQCLPFAKVDPRAAILLTEPEYVALLERIGLI